MSFGRDKIIEKLAKNVKEKAEILEENEKYDRAERERQEVQYRRYQAKVKAQIDYEKDLRSRQAEEDQRNYAKTEGAKLDRAEQHRLENLKRDREAGLTNEEIRLKYMNTKERVAEINKRNSGELETKISRSERAKFFDTFVE